ncbi:hypothetical protein [Limibacterium fermenti]|uniref:hypothetical protein n=1 Tax=Limibacterium fermenti TaxID=3229863 RepID=UPI000E99A256|nr:hypothetical protein [Porphyromonadaceae bacterium]
MKNLEFSELRAQDLEEVNGGGAVGPALSYYANSSEIEAGRQVLADAGDFIVGFVKGLFNL